jgi:hypothetical protein
MAIARLAESAERIVYRIAGFPLAASALLLSLRGEELDPLQAAFVWKYWHPDGLGDWSELLAGLVVWPLALVLASVFYTGRNGRVIRSRDGTSIHKQMLEQVKFYFTAGILPPWYYIFSLHDDGDARVATYIQRLETKRCLFPLLKPKRGSPLTDKARFADYCHERGLPCVETIMHFKEERPKCPLPDRDLFVKPVNGRGGRGAERWDCVGPSNFENPKGERLAGEVLFERLIARSKQRRLIVQPRLRPHPDLASLTSGALPTLRVLTCLGIDGEPQVMAAMLRTSFGKNRTVDNLHAGGIGALIQLESGALSKASNLGSDARLGWFSVHPDTRTRIEGWVVPEWEQVKALAVRAHRHFNDRVVIGWDISVLEDGPILIEGNGNPDLDILQRFMRIGFRKHPFAKLLAQHLQVRLNSMAGPRQVRDAAPVGPSRRLENGATL